jgi:DNA-binding NarL/FixJ family response regulator
VARAAVGDIAGSVNTVDTKLSVPVRVLVVEGERLARAGLRALLEAHDDVTVVAEAHGGDAAVAEAVRVAPDVIVVAATRNPRDGIEATRRIVAAVDAGVVLLMARTAEHEMFAALRAGTHGLLATDAEPSAFADAIRVVSGGETFLAPVFAARLVADFLARPERVQATRAQFEELTPREREVVALVACGLSNDEIAERLVVTRATAKTHVSRALCKLRARDRAQLVVLAYESGLVRAAVPSPIAADWPARVSRIANARVPSGEGRMAA